MDSIEDYLNALRQGEYLLFAKLPYFFNNKEYQGCCFLGILGCFLKAAMNEVSVKQKFMKIA